MVRKKFIYSLLSYNDTLKNTSYNDTLKNTFFDRKLSILLLAAAMWNSLVSQLTQNHNPNTVAISILTSSGDERSRFTDRQTKLDP